MRIYLDMCCYNRPYDEQLHLKVLLETLSKLYIQFLIKEGKIDLITSYMLYYECSKNPNSMRRDAIFNFMDNYAYIYVGTEHRDVIQEKVCEIMNTGVKFKDVCYVASAILAGSEYFISTDKRLLKYKSSEIKMVNLIDFIREVDEQYD